MSKTLVNGSQVLNGTIARVDINTNIAGSAVITKLIASTGVTITSTGADAGTGDVTISIVNAVNSVFGRTGTIVKATGDYAVADVTGAAPIASPTFTGTPTTPTATAGVGSLQISNGTWVLNEISNAINTAVPSASGNSRKTIKSNGTTGSYQYQVVNDIVGGVGIYATLALASASSESIVRQKGQIITVTDDTTTANNGKYTVNADLSLSIISTSQFTMGQFGAYTATTAGAQTISTLGTGAVGVFSVTLLESNGGERPLGPAEYSVSNGILTITTTAQVAVGDVITGYYYGASAPGQVAVQPLGGIFRGSYTAGLTYQQYDTILNPSGAFVAASSLISSAPSTYSSATWFDPVATKLNYETYTAIAYSSSMVLDFSAGGAQTLTATGSVTFTSISNKVVGKSMRVFITNTSGITMNVTLPSVWNTQGVIAPSIAANKTGVVTAEFVGTTESQVWASITTQQ